jgi:hypothetical protein
VADREFSFDPQRAHDRDKQKKETAPRGGGDGGASGIAIANTGSTEGVATFHSNSTGFELGAMECDW